MGGCPWRMLCLFCLHDSRESESQLETVRTLTFASSVGECQIAITAWAQVQVERHLRCPNWCSKRCLGSKHKQNMLKQGQWSWQGMHHARSNTPYKGLSFSWQAVSVKSSSEAAKRNSATTEALVKPFTTSKLFLSTSQPAPAWDSWTIERNNALKSINCEPHNMFWTPHNFCEKSFHKNLTPDPIIGIEQSNGSRPRSKPPNKMDSAVWSQSVTTGRPSSGLSNLFWVKHINGFYQVLAKSIVFVFLGVGKLKQKPDNKKSGRKHVIGSLVVSLSIDGSSSLTYHRKCSHVLLFQQKQSETN